MADLEARELAIEALAQTLAPRLFKIFGINPEEMGFPIYDTKEEVDQHLDRQFNPVRHWTGVGREIAESIFRMLEAGGVSLTTINIDALLEASKRERPDFVAGEHVNI